MLRAYRASDFYSELLSTRIYKFPMNLLESYDLVPYAGRHAYQCQQQGARGRDCERQRESERARERESGKQGNSIPKYPKPYVRA